MTPFTMRLFQHPNGYWYAELERNRRRSLGTRDKAEAQKLYRRLKAEFLLNRVAFLKGSTPSKSLEDFASEYLDWVYQAKAHNTYIQARGAFKALVGHISPDTPIGQITRQQLDRIQGDMTRQAKASSINTRFRYYATAFKKAVEWGHLEVNPFAAIKALKEQEVFPRYLEQEEIARIIEAEKHPRYLALWLFLLLTGCRRSEAMALTWKNIDFIARRITILKTKNRRPKIVPISSELQSVLEALVPGVGKLWPWSLRQASRRFQQLVRRLGIEARLHDLRHTYASYMAMLGVDLLTIKNLMGHKDIKSTQIYAHLSPGHMEQAQAKLANALNLRAVPRKTKD
jgi:integrase